MFLHQESLDTVSTNHHVGWRPREHREAPILRGHQRQRVALVAHKLDGRQMPGPAEVGRVHDHRQPVFDRFGHGHLLDSEATLAARDLGAEGNQLILLSLIHI